MKRLLRLAACLILICVCIPEQAQAQSAPLTLSPSNPTIEEGQPVSVTATLDNTAFGASTFIFEIFLNKIKSP